MGLYFLVFRDRSVAPAVDNCMERCGCRMGHRPQCVSCNFAAVPETGSRAVLSECGFSGSRVLRAVEACPNVVGSVYLQNAVQPKHYGVAWGV